MDTEERSAHATLLSALDVADWVGVLSGVGAAEAWLLTAAPGDPRVHEMASRLAMLAGHPKWEIRRAVANVAAQVLDPAFEPALVKLATDDNSRVRQAAAHAALRRRDWRNASALGRQHKDRINSILDDIEARFGPRGRDAVKRASEQIANIFSRELYHEVIKLLSPLATSADKLRIQLSDVNTAPTKLADEAARIGQRVTHLRKVLDGMRAYTAQPALTYAREGLREIMEDAVSLVLDAQPGRARPSIDIQVDAAVGVEVSRARLVQAFTNIVENAIESYDEGRPLNPIIVRATLEEGRVAISIEDSGCGMSEEALKDAPVLFATSKLNGTGFGLPLAIKIIESEHGGHLSLESVKGQGTIVRVVLPQQQQRGL